MLIYLYISTLIYLFYYFLIYPFVTTFRRIIPSTVTQMATTMAAGNLSVAAPVASRLSSPSTSSRGFYKPVSSMTNSSLYRNFAAKIRASSSTATVKTTQVNITYTCNAFFLADLKANSMIIS